MAATVTELADVVPLTGWMCVRCGHRTPAPDPAACCPGSVAIRVGVIPSPQTVEGGGSLMQQRKRVLRALQARGPEGISALDFNGLGGPVIDGGPAITRVGARIHELRDLGYRIHAHRGRAGFAVYHLATPNPVVEEARQALDDLDGGEAAA